MEKTGLPADSQSVQRVFEKVRSNPSLYADLAKLEGIMFNFPHGDGFRSNYMPLSLLPCRVMTERCRSKHEISSFCSTFRPSTKSSS